MLTHTKIYRAREQDHRLSEASSFSLPDWHVPSDIASTVNNGQPALFVALAVQGRGFVSQYTLDGKVVLTWNTGYVPSGLDFDPRTDTVYVANSSSPDVYAINANDKGGGVAHFAEVVGAGQLGPVIVDETHNQLLIGDVRNGEVYSLSLTTHKSHLLAGAFRSPQALLLSPDHTKVYVADAGGRAVYQLDLSRASNKPLVFSKAMEFKEPVGLALLSDGYIAVADDRADAVFVLTPTGAIVH